MKRKTKIICTLGPASQRKETMIKMAQNGMDVVRLNFSHGNYEEHLELIKTIREVNRELGLNIQILQDLEGYRLRLGHLSHPVELIKYQRVLMRGGTTEGPGIPLDSDIAVNQLKKGMDLYIDDGKVHLKVLGRSKKGIQLDVVQGGILKSRKGVNIPAFKLYADILTEKDKSDIAFGIHNQMDFIAQSFVRNKQDIMRVEKLVKPLLSQCRIIAKIENQDGVRNVVGIMDSCDGIMIARGDLGVSLPIYQIPLIQKKIIRKCNKKKKMVITATQMLESMTDVARPTRAEVSDVANAILDGTDYVMLSAETASGSFPVKSVRMMRQIIEYTEKAKT